MSILTETGIRQAEKCRKALADIQFDQCFSSPISRAKVLHSKTKLILLAYFALVNFSAFEFLMQTTAEVMWEGREKPLVFLDSLKEAHLFYLEGMKNGLCPCILHFHIALKLKHLFSPRKNRVDFNFLSL